MDTNQERNLEEVTIIWNGGLDTYLIDPSSVRSMTAEEAELIHNNKYWPSYDGNWLRCSFISPRDKIWDDAMVVRIKQHIEHIGRGN